MNSKNNKKYSGNAIPKKCPTPQRFSPKPKSTPTLKSFSKCEALSKLKNEAVKKCPSLSKAQSKSPFNSKMRYDIYLARKKKEMEQKINGVNQISKAKRDENLAALKGIIPIAKSPPCIRNKLTDCLQQMQEHRSVYDKRPKPYNIMAKIINIIAAHDRKFERLEYLREKEARMQRRQRMMKYKYNENKYKYSQYGSDSVEMPESPKKHSTSLNSKLTKNQAKSPLNKMQLSSSSSKSLKNGFTKKVLNQKINVNNNPQTFSKFNPEVSFSTKVIKDDSLRKKPIKNDVPEDIKCEVLEKTVPPSIITNVQSLSKTYSEENTKENEARVPRTPPNCALKDLNHAIQDGKVLSKFFPQIILSDESSDENVDHVTSKKASNNSLVIGKILKEQISDVSIGSDFVKSLQDEIDHMRTKIKELEIDRPTNNFTDDLDTMCSLRSLDDLELFELIDYIENLL